MAVEVQIAVPEPGEGGVDNIGSKDVLGLRFELFVLSIKVSVVLQVDVALSLSFLPGAGGSCITSL